VSVAAIRDYLKTKIAAVPGVGVVHNYERWAADWGALVNLYVSNDKLNGWHITRRSTPESWDSMPVVERYHTFEISGIYALKDADASEKTFQDLVEAVMGLCAMTTTWAATAWMPGPSS